MSTFDVDTVDLGNRSSTRVKGAAYGKLSINGYQSEETIYILHMPEEVDDKPFVAISQQWLANDNPRIDWHTTSIHIARIDGLK